MVGMHLKLLAQCLAHSKQMSAMTTWLKLCPLLNTSTRLAWVSSRATFLFVYLFLFSEDYKSQVLPEE